ncbi:MAG: PSD1 and planctomycete cytochrome C domain-containing protein [Planctomycetaceae bacterium]
MPTTTKFLACFTVLAIGITAIPAVCGQAPVDFLRTVQPILSRNCYACHGPDRDTREGDLRLDMADAAYESKAIVPGQPQQSELIARITSTDADHRMPPADSGKVLTDAQVELLRRWISEGAKYDTHWSFRPVTKPDLPQVSDSSWITNEVDAFILAELDRHGLTPMPEADRETLIRRVSLDLTGLPPSIDDVDRYLSDTSDDAFKKLVDRTLASARYGEHMARYWLDAARYADTFGLHEDDYQGVWPYRDWVICAFNDNKPFDRFTIEQLAGDLLPEPTTDQLVATGFNRCHVSTNEGGVIDEEFLVRYAVDRTSTTATVWMGLTAGCATCHDHKFDPLSMKEFYSLMAFFNNVDEKGRNGYFPIEPSLWLYTEPQRRSAEALEVSIQQARTGTGSSLDSNRDAEVARLTAELAALRESVPVTMIMRERVQRRPNHVLVRGQYDQQGEPVAMDVPAFLPTLTPKGATDRLAFAEWLCRPEHPLTSRVIVNRFWQQCFGTGIVETSDDFGSQGSLPSHPELLDYLAWRFMHDGWDIKDFMRLLLNSSTYRQSSRVTPIAMRLDPLNRLLSRGARFRLEGEVIRDCALSVSGLLSTRMEGPPVKPYQPDGLWEAVAHHASKTAKYTRDSGESLYRRSIYTFWKRGAPPPTMQIFDAPNRDSCVVRRDRTNTPLQALLTMNDTQFVEAARVLGTSSVQHAGPDQDRITLLFRRCLSRQPNPEEAAVLDRSLTGFRQLYQAHPEMADALIHVGDTPVPPAIDPVELAVWTMVGNQLMNLDEFVMKE